VPALRCQRDAARTTVARLRSRIIGLFGALREEQDRTVALEVAAWEALDEWEDCIPYKGNYLAAKHGDRERIAELRALVVGAEAAIDPDGPPPSTGAPNQRCALLPVQPAPGPDGKEESSPSICPQPPGGRGPRGPGRSGRRPSASACPSSPSSTA
jgi:hypothetical protein